MGSGGAELEDGAAELKVSVGREGGGNTPDGEWPGGQGKRGSGLWKLPMSAAPGGGRTDPKDSLAGSTIPSAVRLSDHMRELCPRTRGEPDPERADAPDGRDSTWQPEQGLSHGTRAPEAGG